MRFRGIDLRLDEDLFIINVFYQHLDCDSYIEALRGFVKGEGNGSLGVNCIFPSDLELSEKDQPVDAVQFVLTETQDTHELVVSYEDFIKIQEKAINLYLEEEPSKKLIFDQLLKDMKSDMIDIARNDYITYKADFEKYS